MSQALLPIKRHKASKTKTKIIEMKGAAVGENRKSVVAGKKEI